MASMTTVSADLLIRSEVWSQELKEILQDELLAMQYVQWMTDFPDGDTFTIPSIGDADVDDYTEDTDVVYRPLDTGEFKFQITDYLTSGHYITRKAEQDAFYSSQLISSFVPKEERAIMTRLEQDILGLQSGQTAGNNNQINGADHRFVATGSSNSIAVSDFAKARYALKMANVPDTNLVAIVDPSVEYDLNTLSNLVDVSNNPRWEGIVSDGIASGMRFVKNVYGFDVYTSQHLTKLGTETLDSTSVSGFPANLFFSTSVPAFIGAFRQMPMVDTEFNKDKQRTEFLTTCRYGVSLYRPENLVVVPSAINV